MQPRAPPRLQPPFITPQPVPVSPVMHWCSQPEQQPSRRGLTSSTCHSLGDCSSLSRSIRDVPQTGKLWHGRSVELRPGSPTLIITGCQGVDDIHNSRGIRRDAPLDPELCTELADLSPRRWQPGFVFGRFECAPGDRDLPHPPGNGLTAPFSAPLARALPAATSPAPHGITLPGNPKWGCFGSQVHPEPGAPQTPAQGQDELAHIEKK